MRKTAFWLVILLAVLSLPSAAAQPLPRPEVTILINRDGVNLRVLPAIGAEVLGFAQAGNTFPGTGRSPDNEWVRIDFNGQEAWVGMAVINVFGDFNALPVADPRSIPYGGFESPRAGESNATSAISARLPTSGIRLRAGPSTAYPVLANIPRYTVMPLLGRTASNSWFQVNYNGTLGWIANQFIEIQNGTILDLPIDGVVASAPPVSEDTRENYIATLQLMLDRINLAQPSLDAIRGTWTTVALGQRAACQNFPARPSDINIANPLLAAFYGTLQPLQADFNTAMANVRLAIDLWIEACGFPQPPNGVIGQATVQGALNAIQVADAQFAELRRRLNELLPPLLAIGPNQCAFTFQGQTDVLNIIGIGQLVLDSLTPRKNVTGYCIDATAGQALRIELVVYRGNATPLISFSPIDNPTNFIGVGRVSAQKIVLAVGPILIPATGRYLLVVADTATDRTEALSGDYGLLVSATTGTTTAAPTLGLDPVTGLPVINPVPTLIPGLFPTTTPIGGTGATTCPSLLFTCSQLFTCGEARACLQAGNFSLDNASGDPSGVPGNGIPCESPPLSCR
ncbi:MAG: SH3 domain-containing protein [Chloroflexi bacterium]|nr:SH3 domain-containing protein [Chloroflexota bacterium]